MKIGILTQPLRSNYGGVLQNFALQTVLQSLGHEPRTIMTGQPVVRMWTVAWAKYLVKVVLRYPNRTYPGCWRAYKNRHQPASFVEFVDKYICHTEPVCHIRQRRLARYGFDAYVVGSDQTWRPQYNVGYLYDMYLRFAEGQSDVKKIAYAASFGVEDWEYDDVQTEECRRLAQKFDFISVREQSGVSLCKHYLNADAEFALDPTLLLSADDYRAVIPADEPRHNGGVLVYILDMTPEKQRFIDEFCKRVEKQPFYIGELANRSRLPSIESWLAGFDDADYVLTDSFHGTAFSIIFNKPFYAIGNVERGLDRFNSELSLFGLGNRLLLDVESVPAADNDIDWTRVNALREAHKQRSISYLQKAL